MARDMVVIIGAGLSGLATGAYLSKAGFKVKIFEKTPYIGGRCRSIWLGNEEFGRYPFDVGPIFSGLNIVKLIKERLKEPPAFKISPVKIYICFGDKYIIRPFSLDCFKALGLSVFEAMSVTYRFLKQRYLDAYSYMSSHNDIACFIAKNQLIRNLLNMRASLFHGCLPDDMPGYTFNPRGYGKPFYPVGGMQKIPDTLVNIIKKYNGQIYINSPVSEILMEDERAIGVLVKGETIKADFIISGTSIVETILRLCKRINLPSSLIEQMKSYKQGLEVSMIFLILDKKKLKIENGNVLYAFLPTSDLNHIMHQLFDGIYPITPPFGVFFTQGKDRFRPATLLFYTPKGERKKECIIKEGRRLIEKANRFIPNFTDSILWEKIVTSLDYPGEIGFKSCVLPVAESKAYQKLSFQLPIKNLFNVGSSVLPAGGGTVQAVKSGLECGDFICSLAKNSL